MTRQERKAHTFRALHEGAPFVIPNPWDAGSARVLEALGFEALATTSSGFAFTLGRLDGGATLEEVVEHAAALDRATDLPVSVDLEHGYGGTPEAAAEAIRRVADAGAVGGSIEDYDPEGRLYEPGEAVERVAAAVEAARGVGFPFVLTARAENHIRGNPDLADTIARLQAYEAAGADVLYAPGLTTSSEIREVCASVTRPVNVLALGGLTLSEVVQAGAQRVSVGGGLTWVAIAAFAEAARAIREDGDLSALGKGVPLREWSPEALRKAARRGAVGHEATEQLPVVRDEPVQRVGHAPSDERSAENRAVGAHETPAREALLLRERGQKRIRLAIVERQHREAPPAIESDDDTRRPAAEASARVVEQHRPPRSHCALSKPSSVARTRGPIVSST